MRSVLVVAFMLLSQPLFGQVVPAHRGQATNGLTVELRTGASRAHLADKLVVSVFFRSPRRSVTIWNAFGWNAQAGLSLKVIDASGHQVSEYYEMGDYAPPDLSGRNALVSIGFDSFAGFDSRIPVDELFPGPGAYTLKCVYRPPLPRDYFKGNTIWGPEDGPIESAGIKVTVTKQWACRSRD